jgi:putative flippase GtrA
VRLGASVREYRANSRVLIDEIVRFGVAGALAYVIDVGLFNVLVLSTLAGEPLVAKAISTAVSVSISYVLNRRWTFAHRGGSTTRREFVTFVFLSLVGLAITLGCLAFSEYVLHARSLLARNVAGNVVGVALAMVFRFWSYRRWVFVGHSGGGAEPRGAVLDAAEAAVRTSV